MEDDNLEDLTRMLMGSLKALVSISRDIAEAMII
jgi:hypothetical protein